MGFAASMAQFLLCGGAPGQRSAYAHSRILMHQPLGAVSGYAVDIAIQAEQFTVCARLMAELTAEHTGQTVERILADGDRDRWFTAPRCARLRDDRPHRRTAGRRPADNPRPISRRAWLTGKSDK